MACDVGIAGNTWGFDLDPSAVRLCRMILSIVEHCCAHMWVIQHIDQQFAFPEALLRTHLLFSQESLAVCLGTRTRMQCSLIHKTHRAGHKYVQYARSLTAERSQDNLRAWTDTVGTSSRLPRIWTYSTRKRGVF